MSHAQLKIQLLKMLAELQPVEDIDFRPIETWALEARLGAAAFDLVGKTANVNYPTWQKQFYTNIFRHTLHQKVFTELATSLQAKEIDILLLKGAAISRLAWSEPYLRFQADVDFMVRRESMHMVSEQMLAAGFEFKKPHAIGQFFADLPLTNKEGQLEMYAPVKQDVMIEVHSEVFLGHVQRITSDRQERKLWEKRVSIDWPNEANVQHWRLSNEDLLLHTLIHTAVNHQFNKDTQRNLIDLIRLENRLEVDWNTLHDQIKLMKVQTPVWLVLSIMQDVFGRTEFEQLAKQLEVSRVRKFLLKKLVNKESILDLQVINQTKWRYALLLLMVDRPLDMLRLLMQLPKISQER
ncbi:MAG: nucleotidyltransferase family protein [Anaerolineae bacterium]